MQRDNVDVQLPGTSRLNDLDRALSELGMLASCTNSRQEYLDENRQKSLYNMLTINTRYVSNVSIGFQLRPAIPHVRYKPYTKREERHRTKSENNDLNEACSIVRGLVEEAVVEAMVDEASQVKKSKSLENIVAESNRDLCSNIIPPENQVASDLEKLTLLHNK